MLYGSLDITPTATNLRGVLKLERGYQSLISKENEAKFLDQCVQRLDQIIKKIVSAEPINRDLNLPTGYSAISLEAHGTACLIRWPAWFTDANDFTRLSLLLDWRRAVLVQAARAGEREERSPTPLPLEALQKRRQADRERKARSRARKLAERRLQGLWKPRGRPRKADA